MVHLDKHGSDDDFAASVEVALSNRIIKKSLRVSTRMGWLS